MSNLNHQIKQAIDSFDMTRARELLRDAMKDASAETYYLASLVALDHEQKQEFLQKAIALDPFHEKARVALKEGVQAQPQHSPAVPQSVSTSQLNPAMMVIAIVRGDVGEVSLRNIPVNSGLVVTTIRKEAQVFLIARDDYADWFQALYQSPLGIKYGWLRSDQIENIRFQNSAINTLDLPITNFELNTRDDVKQLIKDRKKVKNDIIKSWLGEADIKRISSIKGCSWIVAIAAVFSCWGSLFISNNTPIALPIGLAVFVMLLLGIAYYEIKVNNILKPSKELWKQQTTRYNQLQANMRSDYEMMRDDQRRDTAIGFAANLGATLLNTAASRYIPNRQNITLEHKKK